MRRRHFLTLSATALFGQQRFRFFTGDEALAVASAAARIFPTDDSGPGANEAAVVVYIDRQLAGPYGRDRYRYTRGAFEDGAPEQGYQGKATPREIYRSGLKLLPPDFTRMDAEGQDRALREIENSLFFGLLRQHVIEGMFCDPMHGGNADKAGWKLVGFPGPRMSYADEVESYHGRPYRPQPQSLSEILGRAVRPSEEE